MKKTKKLVAILMVLTMVLSLLTACSGDDEDVNEGADKTLVIAIQDEIEGTDIQQIGWENVVHSLTYSPLVTFNSDLSEMVPCFAESYEIAEDGLSITFHLFEDSKFSNGDPLTAESVKKSIERMKEISEYAGDIEPIESVEVVNETTVTYHLSQPAPFMWASITSVYGGIVNADYADEVGNDEFNRAAVGNGLFYVKEWQAGSQIVLEKNPYFQTADPGVTNSGIAQFDEVIVRFIPDEFTRVNELETGNVDIIFDVPSASVEELEANENVNTYYYKQAGVSYIMFNTEDEALSDIRVRQAINIGIDRETLASVLNDVLTPEYGFLSDAQAGYSKDKAEELAETYQYDPEAAKALLKEAGYEDTDGDGYVDRDGQKLTLEYCTATDVATSKATAPVIQEQLKEIGIDLKITEYEAAYIKQLQKDGAYQMISRRYVWNDADILYYVFTEASGYPWSDPEVTEALEDARYISDTQARIERYEDFHDAMFEEMPAVALYADNYCIATGKDVQGLIVTNDGRTFFNDVTK